MTAEFNVVQQGQETDPLGASKKVQKRGAGGGAEELMPFACIMQSAQRMVSQEEGKLSLNALPRKEGMKGHSDKKNATRRGGVPAGDSENIPGAEKGKTGKSDQLLGVKDTVLAESSPKAARKGEAAKAIKLFADASKGDEGAKGLNLSLHTSKGGETTKDTAPFTVVSKGARTGVDRAFPGTVTVLPEKGSKEQITVVREGLPKDDVSKGGKTDKIRSLTGAEPRVLKTGLQKARVQVRVPGSETAKVAVGEDEIHSKSREPRVAAPAEGHIRDGKRVATPFKSGGINETETGENLRVAQGAPGALRSVLKNAAVAVQKKVVIFQNEGKGTGRNSPAAQGVPEALGSGLKNAPAGKRKGTVEKGPAERASYASAAGGGKNDIGNQPGLKDEMATVGYERAEDKKTHDHTAGVPRRDGQKSSPLVGRDVAVGGYQQTALHAGGKAVAPAENVGITPRALIDQVAGGAKMSGRVRIALNPPSLGTLDMDVLVRDNKVHVTLQAENNDVRQMLQSNMESLKGSLRSQGLVADTIQVFAQEKSDGETYGSGRNEPWSGESNNQGRNDRERGGGGDFSSHVSALPAEETPRVLGDGRISLFA